jgi:LysM repeat protein
MINLILKKTLLLLMLFSLWNYNNICAQGSSTKTVAQWVALAKSGEKKLMNANFTGADLQQINLAGADLTDANLTGTNLSNANLTDCNLYHSNLTGVNLTGANLTRANFLETNMQYINLRNANLEQALLQEVNLQYAVLAGTNLQSANLLLADLKSADLQDANLVNAMLDYSTTPNNTAPEIVETESLGKALDLLDQHINVFVRLTGAKINKNTKGVDFLWAKKNGAVIVAANSSVKITETPSLPKKTENINPEITSTTSTHSVGNGDTLFSICKRYNITVSQLKEWNNLSNNIISIGQVLKVQP